MNCDKPTTVSFHAYMANIKGTDIIMLRKYIDGLPKRQQDTFRALLSQEAANLYKTTLPGTWNSIELQSQVYDAVAQAVHPGNPEGVALVFRDIAQMSYSGIYKVFLRVPTIAFLVSRAAAVWKSYFDNGDASGENATPKSVDFVVRNFPSLTRTMRLATAGHLRCLVGNTGARNPAVTIIEDNPSCWRWLVTWN